MLVAVCRSHSITMAVSLVLHLSLLVKFCYVLVGPPCPPSAYPHALFPVSSAVHHPLPTPLDPCSLPTHPAPTHHAFIAPSGIRTYVWLHPQPCRLLTPAPGIPTTPQKFLPPSGWFEVAVHKNSHPATPHVSMNLLGHVNKHVLPCARPFTREPKTCTAGKHHPTHGLGEWQ